MRLSCSPVGSVVLGRPAVAQDGDREAKPIPRLAELREGHNGLGRQLLPRGHHALALGHDLAVRKVDEPVDVDEGRVRKEGLELGAAERITFTLHPRAVFRQRLRRLRLDAFLVGRQPFLCVDVVDDAGRRPDDSADGDSALLVGLVKCTNYSGL